MSLLVMKFGGTSVGSAAAIGALAAITRDQLREWNQVVVGFKRAPKREARDAFPNCGGRRPGSAA